MMIAELRSGTIERIVKQFCFELAPEGYLAFMAKTHKQKCGLLSYGLFIFLSQVKSRPSVLPLKEI